ncbi:MAG TPA: ACP S-malonyltransferase [Acidimicrobiales bacterium]|nr:ACP S-malonyltransferase [Acidimicrobiales bacterium]
MLAFTFPGQGSQRPGMGASWADHPSFELVEHASEVLGRDVASLLVDTDQKTLTRTANAQLATFVTSLVILDAAERMGLEPAACAGHSLGEYTALVATGALAYEDGLELVAERGAAMAEAAEHNPGTMLAVLGLGDEDVEAACVRAEGEVWVANYNAPGQVVIAGEKDSVERAAGLARRAGARRVVALPVGGAFHTPLMAPARDRLRKALAAATFFESDPAVVANVDAKAHPEGGDWPGLLSAQLCAPVRWRQSLDTLFAAGTRTFVELGPGGVLTGLAKRVLPGRSTVNCAVATPVELEALVEALAGAAAQRPPVERLVGEHYSMVERLIISPGTGRFRPSDNFAGAAPRLPGPRAEPGGEAILVAVGDLVGWAGETEIRSSFSGTLAGVLVLAGERVLHGQPVAWLRALPDETEEVR